MFPLFTDFLTYMTFILIIIAPVDFEFLDDFQPIKLILITLIYNQYEYEFI